MTVTLFGGGDYGDVERSVFGASLFSQYPIWETSGVVARDLKSGYDAAITGVDLATYGGAPFGSPVGRWDAVNDYIQPPAGFRSAFNGTTGALSVWLIVNSAGVWTDGANRDPVNITVDANNFLTIEKTTAANTLIATYKSGAGTTRTVTVGGLSYTSYFHLLVSWNNQGGTRALDLYINGSIAGTAVPTGTWVGTPAANNCLIGANSVTPTRVWDGGIARVSVGNAYLGAAAAARLYAGL